MFEKGRRALVPALVLVLAACAAPETASTTTEPVPTTSAESATTTTTDASPTTAAAPAAFATIEAANGTIEIPERPVAIVSLSPTATEMLFALGAGDQVVAVDEFSYYPEEAPVTDLSGFTPNLESIASYEPDLVVVSDDIDGVVGALESIDIPVLHMPAAVTFDDVYGQIRTLGAATGNTEAADAVASDMESDIDAAIADAGSLAEGLSVYHELDSTLYTVTSSTFVGLVYELFGLTNIADAADPDGFGYPQLSAEYVIEASPDLIVIDDCCGESPESVAARPGWDSVAAVQQGAVIVVDSDISSRWGPRLVQFVDAVAAAIEGLNG